MNPDFLEIGDIIQIENLIAEITSIHHESKRMVSIKFIGDLSKIWQYFYQYGKPIQYSHLSQELSLWDVQTIFSSVPVAVEPSSASFQFSWQLVNDLVQHGHQILAITHATSISSIGITQLDQELPFQEYYWIDRETARIINHYSSTEGSIIGVGTSVTRALEDNITKFGKVQHGEYETVLAIDENYHRKLVNGLLTGMHLPEESHYQLLQNFISEEELENGYKEAIDHNYLWHEYGDVSIITTSL